MYNKSVLYSVILFVSSAILPVSAASAELCVTEGEGNIGQIVFQYGMCLSSARTSRQKDACDINFNAAMAALNDSISQYDNCDV